MTKVILRLFGTKRHNLLSSHQNLAKGAVKASSNSEQRVTSETRLSSLFKLSAFALSLSAMMMPAQAVDLSDPLIKITTGLGNVFTGGS